MSTALEPWIPREEHAIIHAGEHASSELQGALESAADFVEAQARMRGELIGTSIYPAVLLAACVGILAMFRYALAPVFIEALPLEQWGPEASALYALADFFTGSPWWILSAVVVLVAGVGWSLNHWTGRARDTLDASGLLQAVCIVYSLHRSFHASRLLISLSTSMAAGRNLREALRDLLRLAARSPWLREKIRLMQARMQRGIPPAEALSIPGFLSPMTKMQVSVILAGELADSEVVKGKMQRLIKREVEAAARTFKRVGIGLRTVMFPLTGAFLLWLLLSIYSLTDILQAQAQQVNV